MSELKPNKVKVFGSPNCIPDFKPAGVDLENALAGEKV